MRGIVIKRAFVLSLAVAGLISVLPDMVRARAVRRIEYQDTSVTFYDVTNGGQLGATLSMNQGGNLAALDVFETSNGVYNASLGLRCSNGDLWQVAPRNLVGDTYWPLSCSVGLPARTEGAIDDL